MEMIATLARHDKAFQVSHFSLTSLHTTPEVLPKLLRKRLSLESWHWIRDTQLH